MIRVCFGLVLLCSVSLASPSFYRRTLDCPTGSSALPGNGTCVCDASGRQLDWSSRTCVPCFAGWYCAAGAYQTQCPAGYISAIGSVSVNECYVFNGVYVNASVVNVDVFTPNGDLSIISESNWVSVLVDNCPMGYYCNATSGLPTACPAGTYQPTLGVESATGCLPCPAGYTCTAATLVPEPCPSGYYLDTPGGHVAEDCLACAAGTYSMPGAATCVLCSAGCPAGTYSDTQAGAVDRLQTCAAGTCTATQSSTVSGYPASNALDGNIATTTATANEDLHPWWRVDMEVATSFTNGLITTYPTQETLIDGFTVWVGSNEAAHDADGNTLCYTSVAPAQHLVSPYEEAFACVATGRYVWVALPGPQYLEITDIKMYAATCTCSACSAGSFSGAGSTACSACAAGLFSATASAHFCSSCPPGSFSEAASSTACTDCSAGTYSSTHALSTVDGCQTCPAGSFCVQGASSPALCAVGTVGAASGLSSSGQCTVCPSGEYCDTRNRTAPQPCPPGTHRDATGAISREQCLLCQPGTYSSQAGLSGSCPLCPADFFCQTSTSIQPCPLHTASLPGSYSGLACRCVDGYACTYHHHVDVIIALNCSLSDFTNNVGGVRTGLISALAAAGNVSGTDVVINGVDAAPGGGRRLLARHQRSAGVSVRATVMHATSVRGLSHPLLVRYSSTHTGSSVARAVPPRAVPMSATTK